MVKTQLRGLIVILVALVIVVLARSWFMSTDQGLEVYPSAGISEVRLLSHYNPALAGTAGDTEVLIYEGQEPGGTLLVVSGTHADEPSGVVTSLIYAENAMIKKGRLIIIPFANRSGFSHNLPPEAHPGTYTIETPGGPRVIKYGARLTNPIDQWPDPTVYIQQVNGQKLAGIEARNLNRAYPGTENGGLTGRVAFAILELLNRENVDLAVDLHEASPEYPAANAIVAHEKAFDIAVRAGLNLCRAGVEIGIVPSPTGLRGLSHREWGDNTEALAFLLESVNPAQGRLRGGAHAGLVTTGQDAIYQEAAKRGVLSIPYPEEGLPLSLRIARHVAAIDALTATFSLLYPTREIVIDKLPNYDEISAKGAGAFLNASFEEPGPKQGGADSAPQFGPVRTFSKTPNRKLMGEYLHLAFASWLTPIYLAIVVVIIAAIITYIFSEEKLSFQISAGLVLVPLVLRLLLVK